jgi:hypothetical protein
MLEVHVCIADSRKDEGKNATMTAPIYCREQHPNDSSLTLTYLEGKGEVCKFINSIISHSSCLTQAHNPQVHYLGMSIP